mmetsp:Transcript_29647/g.59394  ORF Transcript_29647/g.59394 Transcript_29647/m.59394 type:complete len:563 (-) Transcript_29647:189-1877(-)
MAVPIPQSSSSSPSISVAMEGLSEHDHHGLEKSTAADCKSASSTTASTKSLKSRTSDGEASFGTGISHNSLLDSSSSSTFSILSQGSTRHIRRLSRVPKSTTSSIHQNRNRDASSSLRTRYLHRLGINSDLQAENNFLSSMPENETKNFPHSENSFSFRGNPTASNKNTLSTSLPEMIDMMERQCNMSSSNKSVGGSPRSDGLIKEKVMLLKNSVQYTTELKFDRDDPTDLEKSNSISADFELSSEWTSYLLSKAGEGDDDVSQDHLQNKKVDGAFDLFSLPSELTFLDGQLSTQPIELSNSSSSYLAREDAMTTSSSQLREEKTQIVEPKDGAFDLFSLPSDASMSSFPKTVTTKNCDSGGNITELVTDHASVESSLSLLSTHQFSVRSLDTSFCFDKQSFQDDRTHQSTKSRRKVSFHSAVKATTIPSRSSYSDRIRTRLWSSTEDIHHNAVRNELEYAYDGNDWRKVREENDFICFSNEYLEPSGRVIPTEELVHPVHVTGWAPTLRNFHRDRSLSLLENKNVNESCTSQPSFDSDESYQDDDDNVYCDGVFALEMNMA